MSSDNQFKVGDKARVVKDDSLPRGIVNGTIVTISVVFEQYVGFNGSDSPGWLHSRFEPVVEEPAVTPRVPGTFETLVIESHPQGGYSIVAPGRHWGSEKTTLAAFSTVDEALKFAGENLK